MGKNGVSAELKEVVSAQGWSFYDVSGFPPGEFDWNRINKQKPVARLRPDRIYRLFPLGKPDCTVEEAYMMQGVIPALQINDIDDKRWYQLRLRTPRVAIFSHFVLGTKATCLYISEGNVIELVSMPRTSVVDTFRNFFRIMNRLEYQSIVDAHRICQTIQISFPMGEAMLSGNVY
jgi:hypothetical protein